MIYLTSTKPCKFFRVVFRFFIKRLLNCLVGVCETAHTRYDTEDVVVGCADDHVTVRASCVGKLEGGVVDAGEVAGTRWLVFFWFKCE